MFCNDQWSNQCDSMTCLVSYRLVPGVVYRADSTLWILVGVFNATPVAIGLESQHRSAVDDRGSVCNVAIDDTHDNVLDDVTNPPRIHFVSFNFISPGDHAPTSFEIQVYTCTINRSFTFSAEGGANKLHTKLPQSRFEQNEKALAKYASTVSPSMGKIITTGAKGSSVKMELSTTASTSLI